LAVTGSKNIEPVTVKPINFFTCKRAQQPMDPFSASAVIGAVLQITRKFLSHVRKHSDAVEALQPLANSLELLQQILKERNIEKRVNIVVQRQLMDAAWEIEGLTEEMRERGFLASLIGGNSDLKKVKSLEKKVKAAHNALNTSLEVMTNTDLHRVEEKQNAGFAELREKMEVMTKQLEKLGAKRPKDKTHKSEKSSSSSGRSKDHRHPSAPQHHQHHHHHRKVDPTAFCILGVNIKSGFFLISCAPGC
jgi:hypothetical protein